MSQEQPLSETEGTLDITEAVGAPAEPPRAPELQIELELDPTVNFAMEQNDVPVVKAIRLRNEGEAELRDLAVRVWSEPAFMAEWRTMIASIPEGATRNIEFPDIKLAGAWLLELDERLAGTVRVEVSDGDGLLAADQRRIEVLARDQWSGLRSLPEILAAFVVPNHPDIERLLKQASDLLGEWTGDASLSGYQTRDRRRVLKMAAAIFAVLQRLQIGYINPPASFETEGQKIRLPDRLLANRMGTCLDLALLMAACLEQTGLNPLVVIVEGHAFAGVWLEDDCFADAATDEPSSLRKRVDLGEIAVFETTMLTHASADFERARAEGRRRIEDDDRFCAVVDIRQCRSRRIRPLPLRATESGAMDIGGEPTPKEPDPGHTPRPPVDSLPSHPLPHQESEPMTPASRLDRWKRKLLDLTLNNRLLNFRETVRTLPVLCPDLAALEDALADGEPFAISPRPDLGPRSDELHRERTGEELLDGLLREEFDMRRLHADLPEGELGKRLLELYRSARLSLEESGANTLYLALGFLKWYETPARTQERLAPLILIPLELERRMVREGFRIRQSDDEPRVNITLLELLYRDHGIRIAGLDPIPQDEHGIHVPQIFQTFRHAIRDMAGWDIVERAQIGQFSFNKFLMWRDLQDRSEALMRNRVVAHLVNRPNELFSVDGEFPRSEDLDRTHRLRETWTPVSSDSSQLAAVYAAAEGKSFVLEGPPGTGKSQTITNMIAHALAAGRTVLFVAEKMAALSVVHRRLSNIGLGRFCLELHSNKAGKLEVLEQFREALEGPVPGEPDNWGIETTRLEKLRAELNAYAEALHAIRPSGESVYRGLSELIRLRGAPCPELKWESPDTIDREKLEALRELVDRLEATARICRHPSDNAWRAAGCTEWTPSFERETERKIRDFGATIASLCEATTQATAKIGFGPREFSLAGLHALDETACILLEAPAPPAGLLNEPDWDEASAAVREWIEHGRQRDELRARLNERYTESLLKLDLDGLERRLQEGRQAWWPLSWLKVSGVRRALKQAARPGQQPTADRLEEDLAAAKRLVEEEQRLARSGDRARQLLGHFWRDGEADWSALDGLLTWGGRFRSLVARLGGGDLDRTARARTHLARLLIEGREAVRPDGAIGRVLVAYRQAYEQFNESREALERHLALDAAAAWGAAAEPGALDRIQRQIDAWLGAMAGLQAWCHWRAARAAAMENGLAPLLLEYESGMFETGDLRRAFEHSYYRWWTETTIEGDATLRGFFSADHERKIEQFRKFDRKWLELTKQLVAARIAARVPMVSGRNIETSEMGVLQRELQKRRRHMPIRQLFQRIRNLLPKLKPCLLMSPLSVAQFLDPDFPQFDLVIFDEASQIPTWDAIGAVARGREVVIVGDPKQLPPTNFFNRAADDDETSDDDVVKDLESILDDCISARIPCLHLKWHYRSRHESLIAFSNYNYYDNRLLTFPAADGDSMGVKWHHVAQGVYDKGRSRTNRAEAEAVVADVLRRLLDPRAGKSIGIVTFSMQQQRLVEDLLDAARREHPEIEPWFDAAQDEPVFVKNLENVQGDERDVILFSICYGPDAQGRVSMNFGPLNRDGGERRLNVAITRARREVVVFSTLRAEQIDLARTRARGVADLKLFLEYAERGPRAIAEAVAPSGRDCESPFEEDVCRKLRERGHTVHTQVGCSGYRIDLAIVDPETPGRYLLGIECDGANYHRSRNARDRDCLRADVLRGLGWELHRVWSTDWWHHPEQELEKIEKAIAHAKRNRAKRKEEPPVVPVEPVVVPPPATPPVAELKIAGAPVPVPSPFETYRIYDDREPKGGAAEFQSPGHDAMLKRLLEAIVKFEGPVSLTLAARRLISHYGLMRVTDNVLGRVAQIAQASRVRIVEHGGDWFLWPADMDPAGYGTFRVPDGNEPATRREADDLPPEEIANAAAWILSQHASLATDDLVRETARLFGFSRVGARVVSAMRRAIELLVQHGQAREQEGMIIEQR